MNARPDFNNPPLLNQASVAHVQGYDDLWRAYRYDTKPSVVTLMLDEMKVNGYEVYLPLQIRRRRKTVNGVRPTKAAWVSEPLFGAYVLVRVADGERPKKLVSDTWGIEGRSVGVVRDAEIEFIRSQERTVDGLTGFVDDLDLKHVPAEEWRDKLEPGTAVEIEKCGAYFRAIISENKGEGRLQAFIEAFGRQTVVTISPATRIREAEGS